MMYIVFKLSNFTAKTVALSLILRFQCRNKKNVDCAAHEMQRNKNYSQELLIYFKSLT